MTKQPCVYVIILPELLLKTLKHVRSSITKQKPCSCLNSQLYEIELKKRQAKRDEIEANKMKIEWGSQIRNYVMHPYKLVKDVRTQFETSDVDSVMNGAIDPFLKAYLMMMGQKEEN